MNEESELIEVKCANLNIIYEIEVYTRYAYCITCMFVIFMYIFVLVINVMYSNIHLNNILTIIYKLITYSTDISTHFFIYRFEMFI